MILTLIFKLKGYLHYLLNLPVLKALFLEVVDKVSTRLLNTVIT